jgi:hypothetical protein
MCFIYELPWLLSLVFEGANGDCSIYRTAQSCRPLLHGLSHLSLTDSFNMQSSQFQITLSEAALRPQSYESTTLARRNHKPTYETTTTTIGECGGDDSITPTLSSSAFPQSSPHYNRTEVLNSSAGDYVAAATSEESTAQSNSPSLASLLYSQRQPPPYKIQATRESLLPFLQPPVDPGRAVIPEHDTGDTRDWAVPLNTPLTSPHPSVASNSPPRTPEGSDSSLDISAQASYNLLHDSAFDIIQSTDHASTLSRKSNRPYTANLGFPDHWEGGNASGISEISDAGDQQYKRQKKNASYNEDPTSQCSITDQDQQLFSTFVPRYELQREIYDALVQTRNPQVTHPNYGFLPKADLYCLVNEESVFRELTKDLTRASPIHTVQLMRKYATAVCNETEVWRDGKLKIKSFRKMFAVLVLAEMSSSISEFIEEDISDLDLPLYRNEGTMGRKYQDASENIRKKPLKCFNYETWSPTKLRNFETYQWTMLAPFFSQGDCGDVKHYPLQDQHILPFISPQEPEDEDIEYLGGYGKVFMVRIHPEHHNFQDQKLCKRGFAIKQLYESDRKAFRKEVNILKKFSGERGHPHVVSLLATYEQFKKYHLMFYRADGNLFQFWQQIKCQPQVKHTSILWLAKQCAGIADGLSKLHKRLTFGNTSRIDTEDDLTRKSTSERHARIVTPPPQRERYDVPPRGENEQPNSPTWASFAHRRTSQLPQVEQYGRHGDINPGNLLWYDDPHGEPSTLNGTLKIADFGQAELNSQFSKSGKRSVANTMTYRPPECDLQPKIIRQSYDIWCLGCVYLEFVTWILGGQALLKMFGRKRMSPDVFLSNNKSDTFFQHVRNEDNGHAEVMIKPAVTKVSIPCHTTCSREPQLIQFSVHQRTPSTP